MRATTATPARDLLADLIDFDRTAGRRGRTGGTRPPHRDRRCAALCTPDCAPRATR